MQLSEGKSIQLNPQTDTMACPSSSPAASSSWSLLCRQRLGGGVCCGPRSWGRRQRYCFDYAITLCGHAHGTCPYFPGKTTHRGFADPPDHARNAATEDESSQACRTGWVRFVCLWKHCPMPLNEGVVAYPHGGMSSVRSSRLFVSECDRVETGRVHAARKRSSGANGGCQVCDR